MLRARPAPGPPALWATMMSRRASKGRRWITRDHAVTVTAKLRPGAHWQDEIATTGKSDQTAATRPAHAVVLLTALTNRDLDPSRLE